VAVSSTGTGSVIDVASIVSQLMQVESRPLNVLAQKESSYQAKLSAFGALSGALSSFQTTLSGLSDMSKFQQLNSTSSDATIATATTSKSAAASNYSLNLTALAQQQSLASAGAASSSSAIGSGTTTTITFQFGTISGGTLANGAYSGASFTENPDQPSGSITIDDSNNSLQGIRDAINKAGLGVTATIVADGSATPNRLVLTSDKTGAASSMKISVDTAGDAALKNLLAYDPDASTGGVQKLSQTSAAQNAQMTLNGIAITSATNTITGAIEGVTLTAAKIGSTNISIARDTNAVEKNVNAFVKSYNDLTATLKSLTAYNPTTKTGGPLVGDSTVRTVQTALQKMFSSPPAGLEGPLTQLSQIGVSFQKDGTLAVDSTKLQKAVASNFDDIGKLFAVAGTASDSLISYAGSTLATKAGSNAVNITQLATKGQLAGLASANTTITAGVNDELTLTLNGITSTFKLTAGSYNAASLAAHLQATINGIAAFSAAGASVKVSENAGTLTISSNSYGSSSKVALSGAGAQDLLGGAPVPVDGQDVAGTLNGVAATGSGQFLTGVDGLKIEVTGDTKNNRGTVDFSQGYASQLSKLMDGFLGGSGLVAGRTDGLNRSIKDIGKSRDALNVRLTNIEAQYRKQYTALDVLMANMNSTSNYLTQQLAAIANLSKQ
jgi:flagellar hook-associated protein 2